MMLREKAILMTGVMLLMSGCASNLRPLEAERLDALRAQGTEIQPQHPKNKWIAGGLGVLAPLCNVYLAWGTDRTEQLPMAIGNLVTWPFSAAWAIPGCYMDTQVVNDLTFLDQHRTAPSTTQPMQPTQPTRP